MKIMVRDPAYIEDCRRELFSALFRVNTDELQFLVDAGIDVDLTNADDETALQSASSAGRVDVVRILLDGKADVDREHNGYTALQLASFWGHADIVRVLVEEKADVNREHNGHTALSRVASKGLLSKGFVDVVTLLIGNRADVNHKYTIDKYNNYEYFDRASTVLLLAVRTSFDHVDLVSLLIHARADVNYVDEAGNFALGDAIRNDRDEIVKVLIELRADVHYFDERRWNYPLMIATSYRKIEIAKLLLMANADVNFADSHFKTPLNIAVDNQDVDTIILLVNHGADTSVVASNVFFGNYMRYYRSQSLRMLSNFVEPLPDNTSGIVAVAHDTILRTIS
jgi:hypothetical protein